MLYIPDEVISDWCKVTWKRNVTEGPRPPLGTLPGLLNNRALCAVKKTSWATLRQVMSQVAKRHTSF